MLGTFITMIFHRGRETPPTPPSSEDGNLRVLQDTLQNIRRNPELVTRGQSILQRSRNAGNLSPEDSARLANDIDQLSLDMIRRELLSGPTRSRAGELQQQFREIASRLGNAPVRTPPSGPAATPPAVPAAAQPPHESVPGATHQLPGVAGHPGLQGGNPWQMHPGYVIHPGWTQGPTAPGHIPQAPANAPAAHGHAETAPGNAVRGGHEATPQANEALRNRYWDINRQEDDAWEDLKAHRNDQSKWDAFERLRNQRKALAEQILAPYGGREAAMQVARQEVAAEAAERGQTAPTATEARNAIGAIQGRTRAEAARIITAKSGGNEKWNRRFLSAFVRWPASIVSGFLPGVVGYVFGTQIGSSLAAMAAPGSIFAAGALGTIPATVAGVAVPFIAGTLLPALPVVAAALAGAALWHLGPRKWLGLNRLDDQIDRGWQATKLYGAMRPGDSQEVIDRKLGKINSLHKKVLRMQNFPRVFGALLGGMTAHDIATGTLKPTGFYTGPFGEESVLQKKSGEFVDLSKKLGKSGWERVLELWNNPKWPEWFKSGESVAPGTKGGECLASIEDLKRQIGAQKNTSAILEGMNRNQAERIGELRARLAEPATSSWPDSGGAKLIGELTDQLAKEQAQANALRMKIDELQSLTDAQRDALTRAEEIIKRQGAQVPPEPPVRPRAEAPAPSGAEGLLEYKFTRPRFADLSSVIDQKSDVKSLPHVFRNLFSSMGFKGDAAEWLIDTLDKRTYNGYGGYRGGQDAMELFTGARTSPTGIQNGTPVDVGNYFRSNMAMNDLETRITNSKILSTDDRIQVRQAVKLLEDVARRGR